MSATLLTDQQKEDINSKVARLRNYLQLLQEQRKTWTDFLFGHYKGDC